MSKLRQASPTLVLVIVCAGVVLAGLDVFIVNVALPDIGADLHSSSLGDLSWVLNAYAIVYAAALVPAGRLGDRYRRKHVFLWGVALFTLASAACGAAEGLGTLVAARVVQAVGAALLTPTSLSLLLAAYPAERRGGAVRTWTAVGGFAAALGPVVGGLLVQANWRWVFLVNVPVGVAAVVIGWWKLPDVPGHPVPRPDALGATLVTGGVGLLVLGLVEGPYWGWSSPRVVAALVAGAALLAGFALHCARHSNPLVDPKLFRVRAFTGASVVAVLFSAAFAGMLLSLVLWDQQVWGWSALRTGLAFAPGPVLVPVFAFLVAGRLIRRFGPGPVIGVGSLAFAGGILWWVSAVGTTPHYVGGVLGGTLLTGVGVGLTLPTLMATAASSLPPESFASGSAAVTMLRQVGTAIGVAVFVAVIGAPGTPDAALRAFDRGWMVVIGIALATAAAGFALRPERPTPALDPTTRTPASSAA